MCPAIVFGNTFYPIKLCIGHITIGLKIVLIAEQWFSGSLSRWTCSILKQYILIECIEKLEVFTRDRVTMKQYLYLS